jgi:hypothetical protein
MLAAAFGILVLFAMGCTAQGKSGSDASPAVSEEITPSVLPSHMPTVPLSVADVNRVLMTVDYVETSESRNTQYNRALGRMLDGVDLPRFAFSTLEATPSILFTDVGSATPRVVTGREKRLILKQALDKWLVSRDDSGTDLPPLNDLLGVKLYPPLTADRNPQDSLFEVWGQGLAPLTLMFGARHNNDPWGWRIVDVSLVSSDTADVTYEASASPRAAFRFVDPGMRYTKRLRFSTGDDNRWRLSAWLNYWDVRRRFEDNVTPRGASTTLDGWWGAL